MRGGRSSPRRWRTHKEGGYGSCWQDPEEAALPPQPWVGGWWLHMDHSPLALGVVLRPAMAPREQPGGRHGISGRHTPGGGVMSGAVAAVEARRCSQEVTL